MQVTTMPLGALGTNCHILSDDDGSAVLIDPGAYTPYLQAFLDNNVQKLHWILLTHGHADHISGAAALREKTHAPIAIHARDDPYTDSRLCMAEECGYTFVPFKADRLLQEGDTVEFAGHTLSVLHTPGHTPGSVCFLCEEDRLLFSGDTLFCMTAGRTDFPGGSRTQMLDSLRRLRRLDGDYTVYPGHERNTTLSRERTRNLFMRRLGDDA